MTMNTETPAARKLSARNRGHLVRMSRAIGGEVRVAETIKRVLVREGLATCRGWDDGYLCTITPAGRAAIA
jgi:hypothetical protein